MVNAHKLKNEMMKEVRNNYEMMRMKRKGPIRSYDRRPRIHKMSTN